MHLGDSLTLDGGASADANIPSGDFISFYRWDLNNDGIFDVGSANAVQAYSSSVLNGLGLNHVGDYTIRLQVIDTNGAPNIAKTDLAILAAVPEPESYAMLLAGLGLIGCMARRRNAPRKLI